MRLYHNAETAVSCMPTEVDKENRKPRTMPTIPATGSYISFAPHNLTQSVFNACSQLCCTSCFSSNAVDGLGGRGPPSSTLIQAVPHPFLPESCLLLYGSPTGGLAILEVVGKTEPVLLQQGRTPDGAPVIGMGLHKVNIV